MSHVQREAFVVSSPMPKRVKRLSRAVRDCELLFVLAPSGAGKDRFFDWWWQVMPKYLFFLVLGLCAVLILLVLRRLRRAHGLLGGASS